MNFFIKYKKIFLIIGFISIILILGYMLYAIFLKPAELPTQTLPEQAATTTSAGLPIASTGTGVISTEPSTPAELGTQKLPASKTAKGGLTETTELNQEHSVNATLSSNGSNLQYYNKEDGKFYTIDKDGNMTALSDKIFHQVDKVVWSPKKNKAILEYPDGANIIYNFDTEKQITLPKHWKDFEFSRSGDQIVMKSIGLDPDNRWLAITNEDGTKTRRIESLGENEAIVDVSWSPNNQTIAMYTEGVGFNRQEVFFVGLNKENFKSLIIEGRDFRSQWAPKGDKLLYSVYSSDNNMKPKLWITSAQGESIGAGRKSLNIETWADKCVFADSVDVYCAVPERLEEGAGLFPEMALNTKDNLYKINTKTGLKTLVAIPDGSYNISNPIVSKDGKYFYFTDGITGRLNKIQLK